MNGPESLKNVKKSIDEIKVHDKIENDSLLQLLSKLEKNNI
jgi:hypothetical protein